jgi:hypothetical protein
MKRMLIFGAFVLSLVVSHAFASPLVMKQNSDIPLPLVVDKSIAQTDDFKIACNVAPGVYKDQKDCGPEFADEIALLKKILKFNSGMFYTGCEYEPENLEEFAGSLYFVADHFLPVPKWVLGWGPEDDPYVKNGQVFHPYENPGGVKINVSKFYLQVMSMFFDMIDEYPESAKGLKVFTARFFSHEAFHCHQYSQDLIPDIVKYLEENPDCMKDGLMCEFGLSVLSRKIRRIELEPSICNQRLMNDNLEDMVIFGNCLEKFSNDNHEQFEKDGKYEFFAPMLDFYIKRYKGISRVPVNDFTTSQKLLYEGQLRPFEIVRDLVRINIEIEQNGGFISPAIVNTVSKLKRDWNFYSRHSLTFDQLSGVMPQLQEAESRYDREMAKYDTYLEIVNRQTQSIDNYPFGKI